MEEEWRDIPGFPGYKISNMGRVQGIRVPILRQYTSSRGGNYPFVDLRGWDAEGKPKRRLARVHALVAEAFIGPRPEGTVVNHKDHNRNNSHVDNLEYITQAENARV